MNTPVHYNILMSRDAQVSDIAITDGSQLIYVKDSCNDTIEIMN